MSWTVLRTLMGKGRSAAYIISAREQKSDRKRHVTLLCLIAGHFGSFTSVAMTSTSWLTT